MFSLNFLNSYGNGSFYPDGGFKFTDRLNMVNEANFIFSSSSSFRRSQLDIGTVVSISEKDSYGVTSYEFYGFIDDIQTVEGGGMNVHALGQEGWLGKQNGVYSGSPWNSVDAVTIFNAIVAESSKISTASSDDFGTTYLTETSSDSLWNAIMNLSKITAQDVDIEYTGSGGIATGATIALKNDRCTGSFVSKDTLNSGKEIEDISVGRSFPIANSITVFGSGEGTTRITSQATHGQDLSSQATWGVIYQPVTNYTISSVTAANQLADAEVAKLSTIVKTYQFTMKVKRYRTNFIAGDLLTLNSQEQSLTNELVRITQIEKGMQNGAEYMIITVADQAYSRLTKNVDMTIAQNQKVAQQSSTFNQYQSEYSNQNVNTCVGGIAQVAYLGGLPYLYMNTGSTINTTFVDTRVLTISGSGSPQIYMFGNRICALPLPIDDYEAANKIYVDTVAGGGGGAGYWCSYSGSYITTCNACGLWINGNIADATSSHCLGIPSSPGAFAAVYAASGNFTSQTCTPAVCSGGNLEIYGAGNHSASFGSTTCLNQTRFNGDAYPSTDSSYCVGMSGCEWYKVYAQTICSSNNMCLYAPTVLLNSTSSDVCIQSPNGYSAIFYCAVPRPSSSLSVDLGTSSYRWNTLYVGSVNCSSDRNLKTNFQEISYSDVLDRYRCMPVQSWEWKKRDNSGEEMKIIEEGDGKRNIGVTAQDFNNTFKDMVGYETEDSINGSDHVGIQDAAIKGIIQCMDKIQGEISCLKQYRCK